MPGAAFVVEVLVGMLYLLDSLNRMIWGVPLLILILGVGVYISIRCAFPQVRLFPEALKRFCGQFAHKDNNSTSTSYRALCTALAATVGTGNLAGVAGAIAIGGPGSIFWMWVCSFFGMATKFAEAVFAILFRKKDHKGEYYGGPMYIICDGLPKGFHWLAAVYAFFGVVASFGVGNTTQVNAILSGIRSIENAYQLELPAWLYILIGFLLSILIFRIFSGGAKAVGEITQKLVPVMSAGYILLAVFVIVRNASEIPEVFRDILTGAFSPKAIPVLFSGL